MAIKRKVPAKKRVRMARGGLIADSLNMADAVVNRGRRIDDAVEAMSAGKPPPGPRFVAAKTPASPPVAAESSRPRRQRVDIPGHPGYGLLMKVFGYADGGAVDPEKLKAFQDAVGSFNDENKNRRTMLTQSQRQGVMQQRQNLAVQGAQLGIGGISPTGDRTGVRSQIFPDAGGLAKAMGGVPEAPSIEAAGSNYGEDPGPQPARRGSATGSADQYSAQPVTSAGQSFTSSLGTPVTGGMLSAASLGGGLGENTLERGLSFADGGAVENPFTAYKPLRDAIRAQQFSGLINPRNWMRGAVGGPILGALQLGFHSNAVAAPDVAPYIPGDRQMGHDQYADNTRRYWRDQYAQAPVQGYSVGGDVEADPWWNDPTYQTSPPMIGGAMVAPLARQNPNPEMRNRGGDWNYPLARAETPMTETRGPQPTIANDPFSQLRDRPPAYNLSGADFRQIAPATPTSPQYYSHPNYPATQQAARPSSPIGYGNWPTELGRVPGLIARIPGAIAGAIAGGFRAADRGFGDWLYPPAAAAESPTPVPGALASARSGAYPVRSMGADMRPHGYGAPVRSMGREMQGAFSAPATMPTAMGGAATGWDRVELPNGMTRYEGPNGSFMEGRRRPGEGGGLSVIAGPGSSAYTPEQWNKLTNDQRIQANVNAINSQTAAVRDLNNARRQAAGLPTIESQQAGVDAAGKIRAMNLPWQIERVALANLAGRMGSDYQDAQAQNEAAKTQGLLENTRNQQAAQAQRWQDMTANEQIMRANAERQAQFAREKETLGSSLMPPPTINTELLDPTLGLNDKQRQAMLGKYTVDTAMYDQGRKLLGDYMRKGAKTPWEALANASEEDRPFLERVVNVIPGMMGRTGMAAGGPVQAPVYGGTASMPRAFSIDNAYRDYAVQAKKMGIPAVSFENFASLRAGALQGPSQGAIGMARGGPVPVAGKTVLDPDPNAPTDSIPAVIDGKQPAALNSGEFVFPEDVTRYYGTKYMQGMIEKARGGAENGATK